MMDGCESLWEYFLFSVQMCSCSTSGISPWPSGNIVQWHVTSVVSYFLVFLIRQNQLLLFLAELYFFLCSFQLSVAESQLFRDSHREINFAWRLCLWKGRQAYINIHTRLFQILSLGTELVDELFFCLIMEPVYIRLYGWFRSFPMHPSLHSYFLTTLFSHLISFPLFPSDRPLQHPNIFDSSCFQ